jgi:hypothetical protein
LKRNPSEMILSTASSIKITVNVLSAIFRRVLSASRGSSKARETVERTIKRRMTFEKRSEAVSLNEAWRRGFFMSKMQRDDP